MGNTSIMRLTDRELLKRTEDLSRRERKLTLAVIDHLIEVERRRLHAEHAHRSLFAYCTDELGYSGSAAHRRISAARAIRRFPKIRRLLEERQLTLSTLTVVAKVLRPENVDEILKEVCGKSAKEAEAVVARFGVVVRPRERIRVVAVSRRVRDDQLGEPGARTTQQTLGPPRDAATGAAMGGGSSRAPVQKGAPTEQTPAPSGPAVAGSDGVGRGHSAPGEHFRRGSKTAQPTVEEQDTKRRFAVERKFTFEFAGSEAFMKKYQRAVALLSNKLGGQVTIEAVFEALLDEYIERNDPERRTRRRQERAGQQAHPVREERGTRVVEPAGAKTSAGADAKTTTASKPKPRSRHVPAATRDAVFVRDRGRCTFIGDKGTRCRATRNLQIDHITPYASGGTHDAANLRLLCATHNRLMAERAFGRAHMAQFSRRE